MSRLDSFDDEFNGEYDHTNTADMLVSGMDGFGVFGVVLDEVRPALIARW